jgi:hypothetical protein
MARGRGGSAKRGGREKVTRDYYDRLPSDAEYRQTAHRRAAQQARKAWLIRLLVVAALAVAVHFWGDDVIRLVRGEVQETGTSLGQVGDNIKDGRDRRSGADWVEGR